MKYIFASIVFSFAIFIVIDGKKLAEKDDTPNEFAELIWKDMKGMAETVGRHMLTECFQSCISCELCKRFMIQDVTDLKVASKNGLPIYYKIFFSGSRRCNNENLNGDEHPCPEENFQTIYNMSITSGNKCNLTEINKITTIVTTTTVSTISDEENSRK